MKKTKLTGFPNPAAAALISKEDMLVLDQKVEEIPVPADNVEEKVEWTNPSSNHVPLRNINAVIGEPVFVDPKDFRIVPRYVLVYGTLRLNHGNWRSFLQGRSNHIGTFLLEKFQLTHHLSCYHTGNPENVTVVDLFELTGSPRVRYETNAGLDSLESISDEGYGYDQILVPVTLEDGTKILAKLYENPPYNGGSEKAQPSGDHNDRTTKLPTKSYLDNKYGKVLPIKVSGCSTGTC